MSHFTVLVIERANGKDAEDLLAPYDENIEVAPYEVECYCAKANLRAAVRDVMQLEFGGDFDTVMRQPWHALPEASRPKWEEHIQPWNTREDALMIELVSAKVPDTNCEECHSTGKHLSQYNPSSKWDWYELGGRWMGSLKLKEHGKGELGQPGVFNNTAEPGTTDRAFYRDIELPIERTYAFITPDGVWHQKGDMGWWGISSNEDEERYQREWDTMLSNLRPDDILNIYDCHI